MLLSSFAILWLGPQGTMRFQGSCIVQCFIARNLSSCKSAFGPCPRTPLGFSGAEIPSELPFLRLVFPSSLSGGVPPRWGFSLVPTETLQFAEIQWGQSPLHKLPRAHPALLINHFPGNSSLDPLSEAACSRR